MLACYPTSPARFAVRTLSALALMLTAVGCVPTFDDNLSTISRASVLAVQAEPAEAAPGEKVQLTALVATPVVDAASSKLSWGLCLARKPLTELGPVNPVCLEQPGQDPSSITPLGEGASVSATLPQDTCRLFGPSSPESKNGEPAGRPVDPDPTGGFYQPFGVTLVDTSVTSLGSVRISCPPRGLDQEQAGAFTSQYRRNENPVLASLSVIDTEQTAVPDEPAKLTVKVGQTLPLRASWAACPSEPTCGDGICGALEDKVSCASDCTTPKGCTGAEPYAFIDENSVVQTRHESIRVSWFATAGSYAAAVTGREEAESAQTSTDNAWTAPAEPGDVRLWLVIRDARGGQSFRSFVLSVQP